MYDPSELIIKYFNFLITQYHFKVIRKEFDEATMGNAIVIFVSLKAGIEIVVDRDQVLITLGEISDPRKKWIDFGFFIEHYSHSIEKGYDIPEKTPENAWEEIVVFQLKRLSNLLQKYCKPFLDGDFSSMDVIRKIETNYQNRLIDEINQRAQKNGMVKKSKSF